MIGDIIHTAFARVDETVYPGAGCNANILEMDFSGTAEIKPGKTKKIRLIINDIPKELIKDGSEFDICFDIAGEPYTIRYAG